MSNGEKGSEVDHGKIAVASSPLMGVVLPIILLIVTLIVVMSSSQSGIAPCDQFLAIQLVYPLVFGALGAVIGGNVKLNGPLQVFGERWTGFVGGGVGAAIIGLVITFWIKPASCELRQEIVLRDFVTFSSISTQEGSKPISREYLAKLDWSDRDIQLLVDRVGDGTRDLRLKFSGRERVVVSFDFYRRSAPDGQFQHVQRCSVEIRTATPPLDAQQQAVRLVADRERYELHFRPSFINSIEENVKKGAGNIASCFKGTGLHNGTRSTSDIAGTLYMSAVPSWPFNLIQRPELLFVTTTKQEEPTTSAKTTETTENETPVQPSSPPAVTPPPAPALPAQTSASCGLPMSVLPDISKFLGGDDLDPATRAPLYANWSNYHCYVWAIAKKIDPSVEPAVQARALRLTVNAIINTPVSDVQALYWQPQATNKRDFNRILPYLNADDHKFVFDLLKSEDVALRAEAVRMVKLLPVDRFELLLQSTALSSLSSSQQERLGIAASFLYYNRIVEWLDDDKTSKQAAITSSVAADFSGAKKWIGSNVLGKSAPSYEAMLLYARAIVERERQLTADSGRSVFSAMLDAVRKMEIGYPSNHRHVAQALALSNAKPIADEILGLIKQVEVVASETPLPANEEFSDKNDLRSGPGDQFPKVVTAPINRSSARLLLKKGEWYLANGPGWVGWFKRSAKAAG